MTSQQDEITLQAVYFAIDVMKTSKAVDKKLYRKTWLEVFEKLVMEKRKQLGGIDTIEIRHSDKPDIVQRRYEVEL